MKNNLVVSFYDCIFALQNNTNTQKTKDMQTTSIFQTDLGDFLNATKMQKTPEVDYKLLIGKEVRKTSKNNTEPKPFKSGFKVNTVKAVINHPILNIPAFTFYEDNSCVECRRCILAD